MMWRGTAMTPEQERAVLQATELGIEKEAWGRIRKAGRADPRRHAAARCGAAGHGWIHAEVCRAAVSRILRRHGAGGRRKEAAMSMQVGTVQLSQKLYAQAAYVSGSHDRDR